ncbi:hypothetical protein X777_12472 [Ooceraea biroi]|uniref:Uncharacterized protein n=1 Tax=Ooceraea biroi TaxID=2015173 RepID=A0A026W102_OOCBI|nr:hypothetical protein X777_12472 [Ooceraea biroi]
MRKINRDLAKHRMLRGDRFQAWYYSEMVFSVNHQSYITLLGLQQRQHIWSENWYLGSIQVTGNTPRSVEKQPGAKYDNIDVVARSAIIKYAKAIGKLTKWPYVHTKDLTLRIERCLKGLVNSSVKPIPTNAIKHF